MSRGAAELFAQGLRDAFPVASSTIQGIVCPSFPMLGILDLPPSFSLGAQTCASFEEGSYTGEVSASLLQAMGCDYVILGHSERRTLFGETNDLVRSKALQVLTHGMKPIVCVGESFEVYDKNETKEYLKKQLEESMPDQDFILAYEPLWAIGTGRVASILGIQEIHAFLKSLLEAHGLKHTPIIYGGSVTGENARSILALPEVAGVLVGGASLSLEEFSTIMRSAYHPSVFPNRPLNSPHCHPRESGEPG